MTTANQLAALTAIVERIDLRAEEDREERKEQQELLRQALTNDRKEAEESRSRFHIELVELRSEIKRVNDRLEKIEPVVSMVTGLHTRVGGMLMVLGLIGGIAWTGVVFFKESILKLFSN